MQVSGPGVPGALPAVNQLSPAAASGTSIFGNDESEMPRESSETEELSKHERMKKYKYDTHDKTYVLYK